MQTDQLETYEAEGWCLNRNLIPSALMDRAREQLNLIIDDPSVWPNKHFQWLDPGAMRHPNGHVIPIGIQRPMLMADVFREIAEHPAMIAAMEAILGGPVVLYTDQIGVKYGAIQGEQGGRSYYHQDSWYWKLPPRVGCNCWIPMHDVGPDAITLAIMPGTQAKWELDTHESYYDSPNWGRFRDDGSFQGFQRHRIPLEVAETYDGDEIMADMTPGDGLFFTNYTWHRSEPNRSGEDKNFYAIAYRRKET